MLSSKRINLLAVILVVLAMVFVFVTMLMPNEGDLKIGTVSYLGGQNIKYDSTDYYSDYTKDDYSCIAFDSNKAISDSKNVTINGADVTINGGGVYEISGTVSNGSVIVNAADGGLVRLILNGVDITSLNSPAIYVEQSAKTVISLAEETTNTLSDVNRAVDAVIYSKDDLVINGGGTLIVNANGEDAIKVNDGLKIMDGSIEITSVDEAIKANDYVVINAGNHNFNSYGDAIKCGDENNDGFIAIEGGIINIVTKTDGLYAYSDVYINDAIMSIDAGDDGVHSEKTLYMNGGTVNITSCVEGFEGAYVVINGGDYIIVSSDDGVNAVGFAAEVSGETEFRGVNDDVYLTINGGTLYAVVGGDGIDSNAAGVINGGYIEVYGPESNGDSSLDFDGGLTVNGGTIIAAGSSGMAESPSSASKQNSIILNLKTEYEAGTKISVKDLEGNKIVSGTSAKSFDWICVSHKEFEADSEYILSVGDMEKTVLIGDNSEGDRNEHFGGGDDIKPPNDSDIPGGEHMPDMPPDMHQNSDVKQNVPMREKRGGMAPPDGAGMHQRDSRGKSDMQHSVGTAKSESPIVDFLEKNFTLISSGILFVFGFMFAVFYKRKEY